MSTGKKKGLKNSLFLMTFYASISFAGNYNYEPMENIKNIAKNFIEKNVQITSEEKLEIQVNQTDQMQALAMCSQPIEASFPADANSNQVTAIELKCGGAQPWRTMVPVNVVVLTKVLVAKRTIPVEDFIGENDLDYAMFDRSRLYNGYYNDKKNAVGQVASQIITAGSIINKKNIQHPLVVHRNDVIDLIARSNAVTVTMKGVAKTDGRLNEQIKAYNPSSKRTLDAVVIDANRAEIVS